jgi:RHS repeat-associated protein
MEDRWSGGSAGTPSAHGDPAPRITPGATPPVGYGRAPLPDATWSQADAVPPGLAQSGSPSNSTPSQGSGGGASGRAIGNPGTTSANYTTPYSQAAARYDAAGALDEILQSQSNLGSIEWFSELSGGGGGNFDAPQSASSLAAAEAPEAQDPRVEGIDVSQFQGSVNWTQVRGAGKEFAFIRATRGNATLDTQLTTNTAGAWAAGMLAGVYHTAEPDLATGDATAEASFFLANAKPYMGAGWMRPVVGVERGSELGAAGLSQWVNDFSNVVYTATGIRPLVYANSNYATNFLNSTVNHHDLWLARYNADPVDPQSDQPQTPAGYLNPYGVWNDPFGSTTPFNNKSWDFWQYTNQGVLPGINPNVNTVDLNVFQGSRADLESRFLITAPPAFQLGINFGPYETDVTPGYVNVANQTFGSLSGYEMGWTMAGAEPVGLNSAFAPDQRYQTYVKPNSYNGPSRTFEVAVPNGTYRVRVVAGSPDELGNTHKFWAEGSPVVDGVNNSVDRFRSGVVNVAVSDGRLTITSNAATAPFSRLAFLDIVRTDRSVTLPAAPSGVSAVPASPTAMDVRWQDNADNEGRDPATFGSATWGQVTEGYKVERRTYSGTSWSSWTVRGHARAGAESYQDTGLTAGTKYQYRVTAVNNKGQSPTVQGAAVTTPAAGGQAAYNVDGTAWAVPGVIQAEDYDRGGEGAGFSDTSTGNAGGAYRAGNVDVGRIWTGSEGVAPSPRQHYVGWQRAGDWTAYTVNVPAAGEYLMSFRLASAGAAGKFHASGVQGGIEINLADRSPGGQWDVPQTAGWGDYQTVEKRVILRAGQQAIRVYADATPSGGTSVMNLDSIAIQYSESATVYGADTVDRWQPYTLTLPTATQSGRPVTGWTIDWGDGTDPDGDGTPGETIRGNPSGATHVYTSSPGTYTVVATARFDGGQFVCEPITVTVNEALLLGGPDAATVGDDLTFTVDGPPSSVEAAVWTVTVDGAPYWSAKGPTLNFMPDRAGTYAVEVVALDGPTALSATKTLAVASAASKVTVSGPAFVFQGRPAVFGTTAGAGPAAPATYAWSIADSSGNPYDPSQKPGVYQSSGGLPTFVVPSGLAVGGYSVVLTTTDGRGEAATQKVLFQVLADPAESAYDRAFVPVEVGQRFDSYNRPIAVARQANGKFVVVGSAIGVSGFHENSRQAYVARFNSDLTLDTTFGDRGVISNAFAGAPGQYDATTGWVVAIDPLTDDIVIAGTLQVPSGSGSSWATGIAVTRLLSEDGAPDPTFHGGTPWTYLPTGWGTWTSQAVGWTAPANPVTLEWSGMPYDIVVLPDRSVLLGGSRTKVWRASGASGWDWTRDRLDDFMLAKLTQAGTLDAAFGDDGFAASINPMGVPTAGTWGELTVGAPDGLTSWTMFGTPDDAARIAKVVPQFNATGQLTKIVVGGSAYDFGNRADPAYANGYVGDGMGFVLARFDHTGELDDDTFGDGGKIVTHFGTVTHDLNNAPWHFRNDFLSNIDVRPDGSMLAVGTAPSHSVWKNTYDNNRGNWIAVPEMLAMAWYTPDGQPDLTKGTGDGISRSGTFVSSVNAGGWGDDNGVRPGDHTGTVAIAFEPDGKKIIVSSQAFGPLDGGNGGGTFALNQASGWAVTRLLADDASYSTGELADEDDMRDPTFGSVGDGSIVFADPEPFPAERSPSTVTGVGAISFPSYSNRALITTDDGLVAVGTLNLTRWFDPERTDPNPLPAPPVATSMIVRYRNVHPTPTNLVATGTGQKSVSLTWNPPADGGFYGYMIARAPANPDGTAKGPYAAVGYAGQGDRAYLDTDPALRPETAYVYRVHAIDGRFRTEDPLATAVPTFAGPAMASTYPDFSRYGLVETVFVSPDGALVQSGTTLLPGVKYLLRVSGRLLAVGPDGLPHELDAEYAIDGGQWRNVPVTSSGTPIDVGLAVNQRGTVRLYQQLYKVSEGVGTARFTVIRTSGLAGPLTFTYETQDDTAVHDVDYDDRTDTVTLAHGVTTAVIEVPILGNAFANNVRSFNLVLKDPAKAAGEDVLSTAKVDIVDDETVPTFELGTGNTTVSAGDTVTLTVNRVGQDFGTAKVRLRTKNGSASASTGGQTGDYVGVDVDVPFANGEISATVQIKTNDLGQTANRDFIVELLAATGAAGEIGTPDSAVVTVTGPTGGRRAGFGEPSVTVDEGGFAELPVSLSHSSTVQLTIPYTLFSGTASAGVDFGFVSSGKVVFEPGQTHATVRIPILTDQRYEADEQFTVTLGTPSDATFSLDSAATTATIVIRNDDLAPILRWDQPTYTANIGDATLPLRITRTGNPTGELVVDVSFAGGTAIAGIDFTDVSGSYTLAEGMESKVIDVPLPVGGGTGTFAVSMYIPGGGEPYVIETESASAVIADFGGATGTPFFTFSEATYLAGEGDGVRRIAVFRHGDNSTSMSVDYATLSGTAIAGADFTAVSGTLDYLAGDSSKTFDVPVTENSWAQGSRSFGLTLSNPSTGAALGSPDAATVTISDNDAQAILEYQVYRSRKTPVPAGSGPTIAPIRISEGVGTYELRVHRRGNTTGVSTVSYDTVGGTASEGASGDYQVIVPGTLTFAPGEEYQSILITIIADGVLEGTEYFDVQLSAPSGGTVIASDPTARVSILDDDAVSIVSFASATGSVKEGGSGNLRLTRTSTDLSMPATVYWSVSGGTATRTADYTISAGQADGVAYFPANAATTTINIKALSDSLSEGDETVVVTLAGVAASSGRSATSIGGIGQAVFTIDEADSVIRFSNGSAPSPSGDAYVRVLTIVRDGPTAEVAAATWTATASMSDSGRIRIATGTAYFAAGATETQIEIRVPRPSTPYRDPMQDHIAVLDTRPDWFRSVTVSLSNPDNASIGLPRSTTFALPFIPSTYNVSFGNVFNGSTFGHLFAAAASAPDPDLATVAFAGQAYLVNEGAGLVELQLKRTGDLRGSVTVAYATPLNSLDTATAGADFVSVTDGQLTFLPGQETAKILLHVKADDLNEAYETFTVALSAPSNSTGTAGLGLSVSTVVIAPLTDAVKGPFWGYPSAQSDYGYESVVVGEDKPLSINYRHGEYTDVTADIANAMRVQIFAPLPAPVNRLAAVQDWANRSFKLTWEAPDEPADYYIIRRTGGDEPEEFIVPAGTTSFTDDDDDIKVNTLYTYRVVAHANGSDSHASNEAHAMLVNRTPTVRPIGTQVLRSHTGTGTPDPFDYQVVASDPEDGKQVSYGLTVTDASGAPVKKLKINATGLIEYDDWTPSPADVGQVFNARLTVSEVLGIEAERNTVVRTFSVVVAEPRRPKPSVNPESVALTLAPDGRTGTLGSDAEVGLIYEWRVTSVSWGGSVTIAEPTKREPAIEFTKAGSYKAVLRVSRPDDPAASTTVAKVFDVAQRQSSVVVSPIGPDDDLLTMSFPPKLPAAAPTVVVGQAMQDFTTTVYDQFGDILTGGDQNSSAHPNMHWFLFGVAGVQAKVGGTIQVGDKFTLTLTLANSTTKSVTVEATAGTPANVTELMVQAWNADPVLAAYATASGSHAIVLTAVDGKTLGVTAATTEADGSPANRQTFTATAAAAVASGAPFLTDYGYAVGFDANPYQTGIFKLVAATTPHPEFGSFDPNAPHGAITVSFTEVAAPAVTVSPGVVTSTTAAFHATIDTYTGIAGDLEYHWTANKPGVRFAGNGTNAAKDVVATFPAAGTYEVRVTVRDPNNFLASVSQAQVITFTQEATGVAVTPARPTVPKGGFVELAAALVDQFGWSMASQPSTFAWTKVGLGSALVDADTEAASPTGRRVKYVAPNDPILTGSSLIATVQATYGSFTVTVPINQGVQAPPSVRLQIPTSVDTLGGAGVSGTMPDVPGTAGLVERPQPIQAIISDPAGGTIRWTILAIPRDEGGEGTVLLRGTGTAGAFPGLFGRLGTLSPAQLPNGYYTIKLVVEANYGSGGIETSVSQEVQIRSSVKLGNMTLPVTDLTENVPGGQPVVVSRGYDSQRAGQDFGLGYGWTLDAMLPAMYSTQTVQYGGQPKTPGQVNGTSGTSLAWNDVVYVTLPGGRQHAFAFRPIAMIPNLIGAGFVQAVATYRPNFVPVDGSAATLQPSNFEGEPVWPDQTLVWDEGNGYMFKSLDNGLGYNPGLKKEFGGYYLLTTVDGTRYLVNAADGRLESRTDLQGNAQTYAGKSGGISSVTDARTVTATPGKSGGPRITHIITSSKEANTTVDLQRVDYGYDSAGNLIGAIVGPAGGAGTDRRKTTYTYADRLVLGYQASPNATLYAVIADGDGRVWTSAGFVAGGTAEHLQLQPAGILHGTAHWFAGGIPSTIPAGTALKVSYYDASSSANVLHISTETRQYNGPQEHLLTGVIDGQGVKVLSATYDLATSHLTQLTNVSGSAAKSAVGHSGDHTSQTTTDPSGNHVYNEFDDHGNVIRDIKTVMDTSGRVPQYYVVTVRDVAYASPSASDESRKLVEGEGPNAKSYDIDWPMVNVVRHEYTSTPFVVPAARANDRFLSVERLKSAGYLKTYVKGNNQDTGIILWASKQDYNPQTRNLSSTSTLRPDGNYIETRYMENSVYQSYVFGRPGSPQTWVVAPDGTPLGDPSSAEYVYDNDTFSSDGTPNRLAGSLRKSKDPSGQLTEYLYFGDILDEDNPVEKRTGGPTGALYATYRDKNPTTQVPIYLTENAYYSATTATGTGLNEDGGFADQLESTTDHTTGLKTIYTYYIDGRTASVTRRWTEGTGPGAEVRTVVDSRTLYDALGRVTKSIDSYGNTTDTSYDNNGRVLQTTDPYGGITRNTYDAAGNLIRTVYPDRTETRTAYDHLGRATWRTDRYHTAATATSEPSNTLTADATLTIYDRLGRAVATERHTGVLISITDDGSAGVAGMKKSSLSSPGTLLSTSSTVYDALGRVVQTSDAAGLRTGTVYYPNGQVRYTGILHDGLADAGTGSWHATLPTDPTAAQLDAVFASRTSQAYGLLGGGQNVDGAEMLYDSTTDPLGRQTRTFQDRLGRVRRTTYADASYEETHHSNPTDAQQYPAYAPYGWNNTGSGRWEVTHEEGWTWRQGYNDPPTGGMRLPAGYSQVVKVAQRMTGDPGMPTVYLYDPAGRLVDAWLPAVDDATTPEGDLVRPHWHYDYDANGNLTKQVDPNGHNTTFTYNDHGQRTSRTLPMNQVESWTFDDRGRTLTHKDFNGRVTAYVYADTAAEGGRLTDEYRFDGSTTQRTPTFAPDGSLANDAYATERTEYLYDDLGRRQTVTDSRHTPGDTGPWTQASFATHAYEPVTGQVASVLSPEGQIHYAYDPATGRHTRTWTDRNDTTYGYDRQGRLTTVHVTKLNGTVASLTTTYVYDDLGNRTSESLPNGLVTTYTYDALYRLDVQETVDASDELVASYDYHVRPDGLRDEVVETKKQTDGSFSQVTIGYEYDGVNRLVSETYDTDNNGTDDGDTFLTYAYDLSGNRTRKDAGSWTPSGSDLHPTVSDRWAYTYNANDRLLGYTRSPGVGAPPVEYKDYLYDHAGGQVEAVVDRLASVQEYWYGYDLRGRLVLSQRVAEATDQTTYRYDSRGNRVGETLYTFETYNPETTTYLVDDRNPTGYSQVLEKTTVHRNPTTGVITETTRLSFVLGPDVIAQASDGPSAGTLHLLYDGHGSTRQLANAAGAVTAVYDYDAFGNTLSAHEATGSTTPLRYNGELVNRDGTYHFRARNYDPSTGRFTTADPIANSFGPGDFGNANLYVFVGNSAPNRMDPTGMFGIAVGTLSFAASFTRFILDPGRNFSAAWGFGRELMGGLDFGTSDPFELAELHQLSHELQLMDIQSEVRRGFAQLVDSQQAMWEVWWSAYDDFPLLGDPEDMLAGFVGARACFVAGTQVIVGVNDDGTYIARNIEDLQEGDLVLARDQHDAGDDVELRPVAQLFRKTSDHVRVVTVRDSNGNEEVIRTTDEHPFWIAGRGWVTARELRAGDRVNEADDSNDAVIVSSVREAHPEGLTVYNFEVAGDHTYFVAEAFGQADVAVWVHNVCGGAKYYEDSVTAIYGGAQPQSVRRFMVGSKLRIADNVRTVNGVRTAVEAKFVTDWSKSIYNPASKVGSKPFAKAVQSNQIGQARDYINEFGQVVYHSNSKELISYYSQVFSKSGLEMSKIKFVLTP